VCSPDSEQLGRRLQRFLHGPGGNPRLAEALSARPHWYLGPVSLTLSRLRRCCGPEPGMRYRDPEPSWRRRVAAMAHDLCHDWQPPPLVVGAFGEWEMVVLDGNHRHAALGRAGRASYAAILVFDDAGQFHASRTISSTSATSRTLGIAT